VTIEIEDFLTFQEILIRALEQFNLENNTFKSKKSSLASVEVIESNKDQIALNYMEKSKWEKRVNLKLNPELYKIRIGKKKTGLPNFDYPPINLSNKIKSSNFTSLSVEYDEEHLDSKLGNNAKVDYVNPNIVQIRDSNEGYTVMSGKGNNLSEKLISNGTINGEKDLNFSSELYDLEGIKASNGKKCCDKCSIF